MKNVISFIFGVAVGSSITYFCVKKKYESLINDEIESVRNEFNKKLEDDIKISLVTNIVPLRQKNQDAENEENVNSQDDLAMISQDEPNPEELLKQKKEYDKIVKTDYTSFSKNKEVDSEEDAVVDESFVGLNGRNPIVISPDEFGEDETYDKQTFYYYEDGVVADENDEEVENVDALIGWSSLETFGEYEDDSVHVKNEGNKVYYEILRCDKPFR